MFFRMRSRFSNAVCFLKRVMFFRTRYVFPNALCFFPRVMYFRTRYVSFSAFLNALRFSFCISQRVMFFFSRFSELSVLKISAYTYIIFVCTSITKNV